MAMNIMKMTIDPDMPVHQQPMKRKNEKDQYFRPAATAAYLHAMRNQRPSYKIRNFVESPEPATLRGTNHYDPSLLWTGLGRRKR
ncbi:hypothetical protein J6590_078552 [Homalodisca vitripennis]|nr:hypothetical protein J6590_078552 [Homalodisca vitripennis]